MTLRRRVNQFYSKARKYVNTEDLGLPASLARFPNLAHP